MNQKGTDTLKIEPQSKSAGVDTTIFYSSEDSIVYSISNKKMFLYGKSNIKYKLMELKSERIEVDWNTTILKATGILDPSDSTKTKLIGTPIMIDGGEEFHGKELMYNFKTQKGKITLADTKSDEGIYYGSHVKKIEKDVLFIADGKYTTCDKENPHFYFQSPRMKLIVKDKIIAEPIYFYIADVPVFAIPFGVFPSKSGRRSGFFAPAYGDNATFGRYLKKIGYYWALSDYYDLALHGDWYTNGSFVLNSEFNYALRYYFNGGVSGTYKRFISSEKGDPNYNIQEGYNINIRHNQEINPWTRADVNFTFMSDNNYRLTNYLSEALQQTIVSNATLSRYWEGTPNSASINISRTQQLISGRIDEIIPTISFNRSQSFPFRRKKAAGELEWYEQIGYSYRANFANTHSKIPITINNVKQINQSGEISFTNLNSYRNDRKQSLSQNLDASISPKIGYFTITPNISFRDERTQLNNLIPFRAIEDSSLSKKREKEFITNGNLSTGISTSTRLYGIIQPNVLGIAAFRHTLTPNLSFIYSKQVYGKNIRKGQSVANFSIGNVFEIKSQSETGEEKKIQLLNLGMNLSYNFSADSLNFSNVGLSYRTGIGEILNFYGSSSFNLYQYDEIAKRTINKFMIDQGKLARLENFSLSLSTSLSGERKAKTEQITVDTISQSIKPKGYKGVYIQEEPDFSIPWRLSLNWNFSESFIPNAKSRSASVSLSLDFNLTENWKFRVNGNYDLVRKEISAPMIQIDRDLHCWVMNFTWVPTGYIRNYKLEIRVKASQLQDVKITKQRMTY